MRILFLTHRLPYAPNRGDRIRSLHLLREMRGWADVDLVSLVHDAGEGAHAGDLGDLAASVRVARVPRLANLARTIAALPGPRPATHTLLESPAFTTAIKAACRAHAPDVVFAYCTGVAPAALAAPLREVPLVLDMVDVDSAKWADLAARSRGPRRWIYAREARVLQAFEREIAARAALTLVTTPAEARTLAGIAPSAAIEVVQNGIDADAFRPTTAPGPSETVVFCGVMNYAPNVAGAAWLAREVWPIVRRERPDARLQFVGASPTREVSGLAESGSGVEVTGSVPDVRPFLWQAAAAAAPLQTARGVQNKVLEAVAAGLPVVVTPAVSIGVPDDVRPACTIAGDAVAFAQALIDLLRTPPADRRRIAERADLDALSWRRRLARLRPLIEQAAQRR